MKPSDIAIELPFLIEMRRPVFIWGPSGAGKSSVVNQTAEAMKRKLNDMRLSQLASIDVRGFPMPDVKKKAMTYLPSEDLPRESDPPGILFLDECNGAMPAVASAAYQLILDHRIGQYVLPKHWSIVAAGNNTGDRGVTHQMPAPLNNRFLHIDYEIDADDWHIRAQADGIHADIRRYLRFKGINALHDFSSTLNPRCFPTPRMWYFVDEIYKSKRRPAAQLELIKGAIGQGHAVEFIGYVANLKDMPDIDQIVLDPEKARLPGNQAVIHAVVSTLIDDKVKASNFDRLMKYVVRLPRDIQAVFVRGAVRKDANVANTKTYQSWGIANQGISL